jgi:ABC-type Fe3+ transport system substrate-binding protein
MSRQVKVFIAVVVLVAAVGTAYLTTSEPFKSAVSKQVTESQRPLSESMGYISEPTPLERSMNQLYQKAKAEGSVHLWGANRKDLDWIPQAFSQRFPGLKVILHAELNVIEEVQADIASNDYEADIVWNAEPLLQPLIDAELLMPDDWRSLGLNAEDLGANGHMAFTNSVTFAVAYRKDRVSDSGVPKFWTQLTADRYKGRIAVSPILFAYLCSALGSFEGEVKWLEFAKAFTANTDPMWTEQLESALFNGDREYAVAMASSTADTWQARGLPVGVTLPEPVFLSQFGVVVLRSAPNPSAARLLGLWLASSDGKVQREKALHAVDLRSASNSPKATDLRNSRKLIYEDTPAAVALRENLIPKMNLVISLVSEAQKVRPSALPPNRFLETHSIKQLPRNNESITTQEPLKLK